MLAGDAIIMFCWPVSCHQCVCTGRVRSKAGGTDVPMNDNLKSTILWTCSIVGTTRSRRQSRASGHLLIMCASNRTLGLSVCAAPVRIHEDGNGSFVHPG